ncbi:tight adherence protein B [Lachnospiraceae bacterium NE2001]|nr:tight adherence protein B [Lachnospiraceae bacterium NE2001]
MMGRIKDKLSSAALAVIFSLGILFIFFGNIWGLIPASLAGVYVYRVSMENIRRRKRQELLEQFKAMLIAMQSALEAGNSMEKSIYEATGEMRQLYGDKSRIVGELVLIDKKLRLNISLEQSLKEFADRVQIREIYDFVEVISAVKKTGGNAIKIIKETVNRIVESIELGAELEVMIAAKKLEQQLMVFMPALVIVFLRISSKGFMNPLYETILGQIIMTVVLGVNILADYLGKKIVDISI